MVSFNLITLAVAINTIVVAADPDTSNWGRTFWTEYDNGATWADKQTVGDHIWNACHGWSGNHGELQDIYYKPWNESPFSAKICVNTWDTHINLEIANLNPTQGFTLKRDDCYGWLRIIVDETSMGGESQGAGWWVRADPNYGNC